MTVITFIVLIFIFHLNEFLKNNHKFQLLQVDKTLLDYRQYFLENLPIIFTNHLDFKKNIRDNIQYLISPLTIRQKNIHNNYSNKFISHHKDRLFIYSDKEILINLISPSEYDKFISSDVYDPNLKLFKIKNKNYNFIEVKLTPGNIIYIPKNWIIHSNNSYNIYFSESIFSFIFTFYEIFPFIKNKLF